MKYFWIKEWGRWPPDCPIWQGWWASHFRECASSNQVPPPFLSYFRMQIKSMQRKGYWNSFRSGNFAPFHWPPSPPPRHFPCLSAECWEVDFVYKGAFSQSFLYLSNPPLHCINNRGLSLMLSSARETALFRGPIQ